MSRKKRSGVASIELVLASSIGAALLTILWPQQSIPVVAPDERAAIAALRQIASAQAQLAASGAIDTNGDGVGEFGFLGELAGTAPLRVFDPVSNSPDIDPGLVLSPPLLPAFDNLFMDANAEVVAMLHGYFFKMFLPDVQVGRDIDGVPEDGPPGVGGASGCCFPSPDIGETLWCCYAWPVDPQVAGQRAFFVNQEGRVLQTRNNGSSPGAPVYAGLVHAPRFDAAYSDGPGTPNGVTGMGAPLGTRPRQANDGNRWTPIVR